MKRALTAALATALALALVAPVAQGATVIRNYRADTFVGPPPQTSGGFITLEIVFQNKPASRKRFTPRRVTKIGFESVLLTCANGPGDPASSLSLTRELATSIKLKAVPPPKAQKPKPGRFAFRFSHSFAEFGGTAMATIDKPNVRKRGTLPRAHGTFNITDLDSDATHFNCSSGRRDWSAPKPVG